MHLSQALDSRDAEMTKRLKYTKDVLTSMLKDEGNGAPSSQPQMGGDIPQAIIRQQQPLSAIGSRRSEAFLIGSANSSERRMMGSSQKKMYGT